MTAEERKKSIAKVRTKKKEAQPTETMAEAWARILEMKLSDREREKLLAVKEAMDRGEIERDASDMYTKTGSFKKFSKAEALRLYEKIAEQDRERKIRELVEKTPDNYLLILTEEQLEQVVFNALREELIAIDTETTGVDVYEDKIVGISLTLPSIDTHVYIPVAHGEEHPDGYYVAKTTSGRELMQLPRSFVLEMLRDVLESEKVGKVLHNASFDAHIFLSHGVELKNIAWDTMIAMHVMNENEESYKLKDLAVKYLGVEADTFDTLFGKDCRFDTVPLDVALSYAAKDTHLTWRLYQFQQHHLSKPRLEKIKRYYEKVEVPLIPVVIHMERTGFILDLEYAEKYGEELAREINEIEDKLREHFGNINFNSSQQLASVIYDSWKLGRKLPLEERQKRSTDKKILKKLKDEHPAIELLLDYRDKVKLYGTYIEALPKQVKRDGRVHGQFHQAATVTGRFASSNPNLQNQPKKARKLFVAPEGQLILSADFSAQEPRLLAHFTEEPALVKAYQEGKDLYSYLASELFKVPIEECGDGSVWRKMMKMGLLATMYGTSSKTLGQQLNISQEEAEEFIRKFYAKYPKVAAWIEGNKKFCRQHGYVEMIGGYRKRRLPEIWSEVRAEVSRAERQTTNARIQGSAAIQTKVTMLALYRYIQRKREEGRAFNLAASIHDEVLLYVPRDITIQEVREIESIMINTVKLKVPSATDIEIGERWGESVRFDKKKGLWVCQFEKDGQTITLEHESADYVIRKMYAGKAAGWEVI